jgi:hypothetical protein
VSALALQLRPTEHGWAVYLSDGQELVRFRGLFSQQLASRYLRRYVAALAAGRAGPPRATRPRLPKPLGVARLFGDRS